MEEGMMRSVMDWALACGGIKGRTLPVGLEVCRRVGAGREVLIVLNHGAASAVLELEGDWTSALTGLAVANLCSVEGGDVQVLVRQGVVGE